MRIFFFKKLNEKLDENVIKILSFDPGSVNEFNENINMKISNEEIHKCIKPPPKKNQQQSNNKPTTNQQQQSNNKSTTKQQQTNNNKATTNQQQTYNNKACGQCGED